MACTWTTRLKNEKSQLFIDSFKSFPQAFFDLLSSFLVPVSDSAVCRPQRSESVSLLPDDINGINSCARAPVRAPCVHTCVQGRRNNRNLLSINILALINSPCQKDITSLRKHGGGKKRTTSTTTKKQPLAPACRARRLPGW